MSRFRLRVVSVVFHWLLFERQLSLRCFTGYHFSDIDDCHTAWRSLSVLVYTFCHIIFPFAGLRRCSGVSLATISAMAGALVFHWQPLQRRGGAGWRSRVALATTLATQSVAAGWSGWWVWLAGWSGCLAGLAAWLVWLAGAAGRLAGWPRWVAGWLIRLVGLAGWLA